MKKPASKQNDMFSTDQAVWQPAKVTAVRLNNGKRLIDVAQQDLSDLPLFADPSKVEAKPVQYDLFGEVITD